MHSLSDRNRSKARKSAARAGLLAVASASAVVVGAASVGLGAVSGTPITAITGWNVKEIYTGSSTSVTAAFDPATANNWTYYTKQAVTTAGNSSGLGLPNSGTLVSAANSAVTFQFQPYTALNGLELQAPTGPQYGPNGTSGAAQLTGDLTFSAPSEYTSLSLLSATANGNATVSYVATFITGPSTTTTLTGSFTANDWFTPAGMQVATSGVGRVSPAVESTATTDPLSDYQTGDLTTPDLYETDITIPAADQIYPLQNIAFSIPSGSGNGPDWSVFALSGALVPSSVDIYTNTSGNGLFDTTSLNFQNSNGTTVAFNNGNTALFNDVAPGNAKVVSVGSAGVNPAQVVFNNNTSSYTLSGPGGITGTGTLSVNGGGTVTLTNSNSYTGATSVTAGTLNLNSGGGIASPTVTVSGGTFNLNSGGSLTAAATAVTVSSGATFNIASGAVLSGTSLTLGNSGTVNSFVSTLAPATLSGAATGVINLNSTALTLANTTYLGTITGTSGSVIFPGTGTFSGTLAGNIAVVKNAGGTVTLTGANSYSAGTTVSSGTLVVTSAASLGSSSSTVNLSGGTLSLGGGAPVAIPVLNGFGAFAAGNGVELNNGDSPQPATVSGSTLTLTHNNQHANASIFTNNPIALNLVNGFTVSFLYTPNDPNNASGYLADGAAFVLQNDPNKTLALGDGGGAVGYEGGTDAGFGTGIQNSFAAILGIYQFNYSDDAAFSTNGGAFAYQATTPQVNSQPDQVTISYNGSNNLVSFTIANASNLTSFTTVTDTVNLATVLGSTSAYVGFTGGEGDGSAQQLIQNFTLTNYVSGPVAITQPIITGPGTSSVIQVSVAPGTNTQSIASLNISSGSKLLLQTATGSTGPMVLSPTSLAIASSAGSFTGQLDIGTNDLDLPAGSATLASITAMVKQGYAGGAWTGNGITSSAAANDSTHLTAVGVIVNDNGMNTGTPLYGSNGGITTAFDGDATSADGDILVKFTYYGDANLDGAIDGSDYSIIDTTYQNENFSHGAATNPISGWYFGDFNYDGVVDGSDYTLMDNAFNQQGASMGFNPTALLATQTAQISTAAVPEPASLGLIVIGAGSLLGRRRRTGGRQL